MYLGETGQRPAGNPAGFSARIAALTTGLGMAGPQRALWTRFLTRADEPEDPRPLILATGAGGPEDPDLHVQVLSRAALLLRFATGSARQLLRGAGLGADDLGFWFRRIALSRGLWAMGDEPPQLADLWADVAARIQEATEWIGEQGGASPAARTWRRAAPAVVDDFGACEILPVLSLTA